MKGRAIGTAIFCLVVLGGYAAANILALDPFASSTDSRELPPTAGANTAGGVFWYGGFSGGK